MATHSSILAWSTLWKEKPGGLQSMGWQRVWHNLVIELASTSSFPSIFYWRDCLFPILHSFFFPIVHSCLLCHRLTDYGGLVAKSCPTLATPWTVAHQAPLSMWFSRQEYWSGLLCPPPRDLPDPGIELRCPAFSALQEDPLPLSHLGSPESWTATCKSMRLEHTHTMYKNTRHRGGHRQNILWHKSQPYFMMSVSP